MITEINNSTKPNKILTDLILVISLLFKIPENQILRETSNEDIDGWDSVSHMTLLLDIERKFNITFTNDRVYEAENVGELADAIEELLSDMPP